ncbi:hypothetical protein N802_00255 [Knoellia sinensis KCTC 19936]|uniref:Uncharacterized protein n=2 Tax=Knoellia TaxID=136099 RepID=A0A0A0JCW4_9MICO|nr:hypothetical protein N802_00255 [Knoellia sinensis KCTC 19936]
MLTASAFAYAVIGKVIDGNIQVPDQVGRLHVMAGGATATLVSLGLIAAAILCAGFGIVQGLRIGRSPSFFSVAMLLLIVWWFVGLVLLRPVQLSLDQAVLAGAAVVMVVGVIMSPPVDRTLVILNVIRDAMVAGSLAFSLLRPAQGQLPCREDKCGVFGGMYTGFYFHENVAASGVLLLMPALLVARSRLYVLAAIAGLGTLVLATGSRTGILTFVLGVFVVIYGQWRMEDDEGELVNPWPRWPLPVRALPLLAFAGSSYLFLSAADDELTGRGVVYSGIRDAMTGAELIFGGGTDVVERISGGWVMGEHGQAPHLLVHAGIVGMLVFTFAMVASMLMKHPTRSQFMGLGFLIVASSQFVTEPGWELAVRSVDFVSILITTGLMATGAVVAVGKIPSRLGNARDSSVAVANPHPRARRVSQ